MFMLPCCNLPDKAWQECMEGPKGKVLQMPPQLCCELQTSTLIPLFSSGSKLASWHSIYSIWDA